MLPEKVKEMRKLTGLSVSKSARLVHVTDRNWNKFESGDRPIPEGVVHLYCLLNNLEYPR